jgi:hypothetical protein
MNTKSAISVGKKAVTTVLGHLLKVREPKQLRRVDRPRVTIIPPDRSQWCFACHCTSDARGDRCPACNESGTLLSVARLASGHIRFVVRESSRESHYSNLISK